MYFKEVVSIINVMTVILLLGRSFQRLQSSRIITVSLNQYRSLQTINDISHVKLHFFQKTVCSTMTECFLLRTTMTMIMKDVTVEQDGTEGGGITHVNGQILMESMETQIIPKGSTGIIGKVSITQ